MVGAANDAKRQGWLDPDERPTAGASSKVDPGRPVARGPGDMAGSAQREDANTPSRLGSAAPSHQP
jgi:hypothetical protein